MGHVVLIVEDNPLNLELATDILQSAGHTVLQAEDARQGISQAKSDRPDLILMDVSLPGMDGLVATTMLKQDPETRDIPVIALTAHAMKGDKEKALEAGCDHYITKPITGTVLLEAVERFVSRNAA